MDRAQRIGIVPAFEVALTVLATALTFYLGVRYAVVDALAAFSSRIGFPVDVAECVR
jgi:sensor domain CHASE-containing protein